MIASLLLVAALASPCDAFNAALQRTYGFRPSKLDDAGRAAKQKQMDDVWRAVHRDLATLVPCLSGALKTTTDDWFRFDGAQLLVELDSSSANKAILLDALGRVSLDDTDLRQWVRLVSGLALDGFDVSPLGKRWLAYPKATYFLPEHAAYQVDRDNGAMFIYGSLDEKYATPALIELTHGPDKEVAAWLLMSQATPQSLKALAAMSRDGLSAKARASLEALLAKPQLIERREPPLTSRAELVSAFNGLLAGKPAAFDALMEKVPDGERDVVAVFRPDDLDLLRKVRRWYISKNTPDAIEFYNQFTQILMTLLLAG